MLRLQTCLAIGAVLLAAVPATRAHEIKALASRLALEPGGKSTIYLAWGHRLPVDDLVDGSTIERYDLIAPDGTRTALKKDDRSLQTNEAIIKAEGIHQVVVERKASILTYVIDADGNRIMKRGPKADATGGTIDHALRSQQFAKALIVSGAPKGDILAVGQPLEIVPAAGPAEWRSGGLVPFRVLFQGKPLAGAELVATYVGYPPENAWCFATETDRSGAASVRVTQPGTWVLRVQMRKATSGATRDQYDFEAYTATLTLEIRP